MLRSFAPFRRFALRPLVAVASLVAVSCSSSTSPTPANGDAGGSSGNDAGSDTGSAGACGPALTCSSFSGSGSIGTYTAGSDNGAVPAGFPAPPATASLCGSVSYAVGADRDVLIYYLNTGSDQDLVTYYRTKLTAAGFTVGQPQAGPTGKPCDTFVSVTKSGVLPNSQVYLYGQQGAFALGPFKKP